MGERAFGFPIRREHAERFPVSALPAKLMRRRPRTMGRNFRTLSMSWPMSGLPTIRALGRQLTCLSVHRARPLPLVRPRTASSTAITGRASNTNAGKHRAKLVNGQRIVAVHQHMPAPLADPHYEQFDLEIGGRLPLTEHLKDSLLGILVLHRRTLRAFEPADHVLHLIFSICEKDPPITIAQVYTRGERALGDKPPLVDLSVFEKPF